MHPINFNSYVTIRPPDCQNHRHTNKKQLNQQVWQPKCNARFHLEGPGLLEKKKVVFFSVIFDVYTHMVHTGPEKSLKSPWIERLLDILENSLKFPLKSLNIFESSLNEKNLHLKKEDLMFCAKEWLKAQRHTNFSWSSWKCFHMISVFQA